jgi:hypothetical protein
VLGIMLALSLFAAGCASSRPLGAPAVLQPHGAEEGNSIVLTIPKGTCLTLPDAAAARQLLSLLPNESTGGGKSVLLTSPMVLCTPAYLDERDAAESALREALALKPEVKK